MSFVGLYYEVLGEEADGRRVEAVDNFEGGALWLV